MEIEQIVSSGDNRRHDTPHLASMVQVPSGLLAYSFQVHAAALSLISLCDSFRAFHQCTVLQVRGSFPLYWSQQGGKLGKPDILLQNFDPLFSATRAHFADMQARLLVAAICCRTSGCHAGTPCGASFLHTVE